MYGVRHFKNKITIFYFLEYNLFNQPTQKSLFNIGDLSMTGLVGFNHEELNPKRVLSHEKKTGAVLLAVLLAMRLQLG